MDLATLPAAATQHCASAPPKPSDYEIVRRAIEFISRRWRDQPSLDGSPPHVGMKPLSLQRLFTRWAGLSPKGFLQAVTLDHARALLADSASVLDASYEVGLSGPGRLHDLFVTHEAMTPGAYKAKGEGLDDPLRLPSLAVRHGAGHGHRARPRRPRLRRRGRREGGARRHAGALAAGDLRRGLGGDRALCPAHLRSGNLAAGPAAPRRHDRHRLRAHGLGDAAEAAARRGDDLLRHRRPHRPAERGPRRRHGGRQEPDLVRRPLPPGARQGRRPLRLPLGPDPQARDPRLGSGAWPAAADGLPVSHIDCYYQ